MLISSMKHTSKHRTRNIHSTEVKLTREKKNIAISFPTCIVCVFPLLVTPYANIVPVTEKWKNYQQKKETIHEQ